MDTVCEDKMAIELALNGGLGIIHRYNTIEQQVEMIKKVKKYFSFITIDPLTINQNERLQDLENYRNTNNIKSYIVIDDDKKVCGIITNRDYQLALIKNLPKSTIIKTIMTPLAKMLFGYYDKLFDFEYYKKMLLNSPYEKLPLLLPNGKIYGIITFDSMVKHTKYKDTCTLDIFGRLIVGGAVGIVGDYKERIDDLVVNEADVICIDVANGFNESIKEVVNYIKTNFPHVCIIAGNVCNKEGFEFLAKLGVHAIRIGIGNGSICTTRLMTGVGKSQLTAIMECADIARKYKVSIIADGGFCGKIGNMSKALCAGANFIMLGRTLAGTDESPGKILMRNGKRVKLYRGMASTMAYVSKCNNQNLDISTDFVAEGVDSIVDYKGSVNDILREIIGGIKSGLSYIGCDTLSKLDYKEVKFTRITPIGMKETGIRVEV